MGNILEVQDLVKYFPVYKGLVFQKVVGQVKAVDGISFSVEEGKTLGLVGESGCGKTTTAKLILRLEKVTSGTIKLGGRDIGQLTKEETKEFTSAVQAVFQDPYSSLNPRMKIGDIIGEPMLVGHTIPQQEIRGRVAELLGVVGLRPDSAELYPHELSGGQRQRIAIARAIGPNPKFLVLDEPVSALDVSIRAQILNLLADIQEEFGPSYLLIAHDLAVVQHMSTTSAIMYLGKIMEMAPSDELYSNPLHPYSEALLAAVPRPDPDARFKETLSGEVPSPLNPPSGCRFHPRCKYAKPICSEAEPIMKEVSKGHTVACHLV